MYIKNQILYIYSKNEKKLLNKIKELNLENIKEIIIVEFPENVNADVYRQFSIYITKIENITIYSKNFDYNLWINSVYYFNFSCTSLKITNKTRISSSLSLIIKNFIYLKSFYFQNSDKDYTPYSGIISLLISISKSNLKDIYIHTLMLLRDYKDYNYDLNIFENIKITKYLKIISQKGISFEIDNLDSIGFNFRKFMLIFYSGHLLFKKIINKYKFGISNFYDPTNLTRRFIVYLGYLTKYFPQRKYIEINKIIYYKYSKYLRF